MSGRGRFLRLALALRTFLREKGDSWEIVPLDRLLGGLTMDKKVTLCYNGYKMVMICLELTCLVRWSVFPSQPRLWIHTGMRWFRAD